MCPFCSGGWVTFAKKRGTHICNNCGVLNATDEEYRRWLEPTLPLDEKELAQVARAINPMPIVIKRLLATLALARAS